MKIVSVVKLVSIAVFMVLAACASVLTNDSGPEEDVSFVVNGTRYVGNFDYKNKLQEYLGIPFAMPPVGELRWATPQEFITDKPTLSSNEYAPACMQGPHLANWYKGVISSFGGDASHFEAPAVSEDCLYLNVWAPNPPSTKSCDQDIGSLPVYVFIHGGSNKGGWSYEPNYVGSQLAKKGVIVVTIAYRLGVFGFLSHPELKERNFALRDQIAALHWVKRNVAKLGGDPLNITVAGESSGANNIVHLLASPAAKGLFQKAVVQSGVWSLLGARKDSQEALRRGVTLAQQALQNTGVLGNDVSVLNALREIPASEILAHAEEVYSGYFFDPDVDGDIIHQPVSETANQGRLMAVDLIVGSNADESLMYLDPNETLDSWLAANVSLQQSLALKNVLKTVDGEHNKLNLLETSMNYACPSLKLAQSITGSKGKAWVYYFSRSRIGSLGKKMGAYHGIELPYIFNTHDDWLPTNQDDVALTGIVQGYWSSFLQMRVSSSSSANLRGVWAPYQERGDKVLELNRNVDLVDHVSEAVCKILAP